MILGRSTVQWVSLITAAGGLTQLLMVTLIPELDPVLVATIIGAITTFLGVFLAFLANTATTPISDPRLQSGTAVTLIDSANKPVGQTVLPQA